jgi:uncharacterized membrane protein
VNVTLGVLTVCVLAASGIQLGTLWIMKLAILPMLNSLRYDSYVTVCQLIDMHVFHPIAVWTGVITAGLGIVAAILSTSASMTALFVLGSVGMIVVGIASEGYNRPIWRQIEKWSPERAADGWSRKRVTWHVAHQVRTYAAVVAVAAYVGAFLSQISWGGRA